MICHSFSLFHLFLTSFLTLPNVSLRVLYIFQYKCNLKYWNTETVSFLFNVIDPAHFHDLSFIFFVPSVNASFTKLLFTFFLLFLNLVITLHWLSISWLLVYPVTVRQRAYIVESNRNFRKNINRSNIHVVIRFHESDYFDNVSPP